MSDKTALSNTVINIKKYPTMNIHKTVMEEKLELMQPSEVALDWRSNSSSLFSIVESPRMVDEAQLSSCLCYSGSKNKTFSNINL